MTIEIGKKYRTANGKPVRIICVDRDNAYCVVGLMGENQTLETWTIDGAYQSEVASQYDLIEVGQFDDFKVDEPVLVRDSDCEPWNKRHFAGVSPEGYALVYPAGTTSWSVSDSYLTQWAYCIRPDQEDKES